MAKFPRVRIDPSSVVVIGAMVVTIGLLGNSQPRTLVGTPPATAQQAINPNASAIGRRVIATMRAKGYDIDPVFNIVGVSGMNPDGTTNDNRPDYWNDLVLLVKPDGAVLHIAQATTDPALRIVQNPIVPPGAAQLAFGQYRNAYQVGIHMGSSRHEALVQTGGPVTILRDVNRNGRRDEGDLRVTGMFGINWHRAALLPLKTIQGYSAGCVVTNNINDHLAFMKIVKSHPGYQQNRLFRYTVTLLNGQEIQP